MSFLVSAGGAFLFAFPALFSIVNPIAGAFFFNEVTTGQSHEDRLILAERIGLYALAVMLVALWLGSYVLNFFGISLAALRIAGGLVISAAGWDMLLKPEARDERKHEQAQPAAVADDVAFYPLTMPFTTGPGTISVAVTLGAQRPVATPLPFFLGVSAAAAALAAVIWLAYRAADRVAPLLHPATRNAFTRIAAFLLLCVGVQIVITGALAAFALPLARP